jgi:hypothetical protein
MSMSVPSTRACVRRYRHLDCASDYGNERAVGAALKRLFADGVCTREELWIASKLWNTYHAKEHVPLAFQRSLDDLGLEYLDLYLIHFPIALQFVPFEHTYPPEWCAPARASPPHARRRRAESPRQPLTPLAFDPPCAPLACLALVHTRCRAEPTGPTPPATRA